VSQNVLTLRQLSAELGGEADKPLLSSASTSVECGEILPKKLALIKKNIIDAIQLAS
jgi:hypothetical protein